MQAARQGDRARANALFQAVVEQDPDHEEALLWLAGLAEDPEQSAVYLQRVLDINPQNARAQAGLEWARERMEAAEAPSEAPIQPAWGGTVDLVPLEPERTRWRLSTVVGVMGALLLVGALVWWASSVFPLVQLLRPEATATEPAPAALPSATGTPPSGTVAVATPTAAAPADTPLPLPAAATATVVAAVPTATPSPVPPGVTVAVPPAVTPSPELPTGTFTPTPSVTPSTVPTPATVWPTPGPTTSPHVTPAPTPLAHTAAEATPALPTPVQAPFPGRG